MNNNIIPTISELGAECACNLVKDNKVEFTRQSHCNKVATIALRGTIEHNRVFKAHEDGNVVIPVCRFHRNYLVKPGRAINVHLFTTIFGAGAQEEVEIIVPVKCGNYKAHGYGVYHNGTEGVKACHMGENPPQVNPPVRSTRVRTSEYDTDLADKMYQSHFHSGRKISNPYKNR